ncbi:MAG: lipocalin family protein [Candidatus Pacebacteria bacterium]|nr:lipocalin family protein [Candidatus Paceibacterota bacterium]
MAEKIKTYKEKFRPLIFPKDHQKHNHAIEWWYFNGNLKTKNNKIFSYMHCLFSAKPKKIKIPVLSQIPLDTLFFSHYLLSDNKKRTKSKISPLCLMDKNSFQKPLFFAQYDNSCLIEEYQPGKYRIINDFVDLKLEEEKPLLLLNKKGFIDVKAKTTYYYSLPRLKTTGIVKQNNCWTEVEGISWMDHQWSQAPVIDEDQWTWFSIQLNDKTDLVVFSYGNKIKTFHSSLSAPKGEIRTTDRVNIKTGKVFYKSPKTKISYPLEYEIEIKDFDLKLNVKPLKKDQEMMFGPINYWEGSIKVKGILKGKKVEGLGFMELLPRIKDKNLIKIILKEYKNNSIIGHVKELSNLSAKSIYFLTDKLNKN